MHLQPVFNPQITQIKKKKNRIDPQITQITQIKKKKNRIDPQITQITQIKKKKENRIDPQINGRKEAQNTQNKKEQYSCWMIGGEVAEELFEKGLCLPSGTAMREADITRITDIIKDVFSPPIRDEKDS